MSAANITENEGFIEDPGQTDDEEYTFMVDLPGLTIVEIPGEGVSAEIDYNFHEHEVLVALLSTLDVAVDTHVEDTVRGTHIYRTVRKDTTHAPS